MTFYKQFKPKCIQFKIDADSCHFCFNDGKWLAGLTGSQQTGNRGGKWLAGLTGSQQTGNRGKKGIVKVFLTIRYYDYF